MNPRVEGDVDKRQERKWEFPSSWARAGVQVQGPNSIIYPLYTFFFYLFDGLSLSCPHTLLSISFTHILAKGWGMAPMGEGSVEKGGGKGMRITEFLRPGGGTGTRFELNSQSHTHTFLEREKK